MSDRIHTQQSDPHARNPYYKSPVHVDDVPSLLLKERIIFTPPFINDEVANLLSGMLLYLESQDASKEISLYINCHGSLDDELYFGLGVFDTMLLLKSPISTLCVGTASGVAALLLTGGSKGKRFSLPNAKIVIHQPSSGVRGQASDINIQARELVRQRQVLYDLLAHHTGQPLERIRQDAERVRYFTAQEAVEYGLVDEIITFA